MKKILFTFFAIVAIAQAQPALTPVVELGGGCNFFWLNEGSCQGTVFHPAYRFNTELGLGIDTIRSLFLPSLGVMLDETKAMHNDKEIAKKYIVIYGGVGYEYKVDEKWSFGLKGTLGIGKMHGWQVHESGTASGTKTSSGRTIEEEMKMMEKDDTWIASIFLGVGYRVTSRIKLKTELFFSFAHDMYEGRPWLYSALRGKVAGITLSMQYIWSRK